MTIEIFNIINQYSGFFSVIASFAMAMITYYYNNKLYHHNQQLLQFYKKDRERPAIVELIQFFISPLIDWFLYQKVNDFAGFEEFNINKLITHYKFSNLIKTRNLPDPAILIAEFDSLVERRANKSVWDEKVQEYNKLTGSLNKKINELEHNVKKFVDENQDVKRKYNDPKVNEKYPSYDSFRNELAKTFYKQYRSSLIGNALDGAWYYAGKEIFEQAILHNKPILEEIEKLKEQRKHVLKKIISILEQLQKQLRVEYDLKSSDQTSQISFIPPDIR